MEFPISTGATLVAPGQIDFFFKGAKVSASDYYRELSDMGYDLAAIDRSLPQGYTVIETPDGEMKIVSSEPTAVDGGVTSGTYGTETAWAPTWWNGQYYNDENDYVDAVNNLISSNYTKSVQNVTKMYQNGLISLDEMEQSIRDTRQRLIQQRSKNLGNVSGRFSAMSPDAFQSSQLDAEKAVENDYQYANTRLGSATPVSYRDMTPEQRSAYTNEISQVGKLMRGYGGLTDAQTEGMSQAESQRLQQITDFNNNQVSNSSENVINPNFAPNTSMTDYQGMTGAGTVNPATGQAASGTYYAGGVEYDYFGNPITKDRDRVV